MNLETFKRILKYGYGMLTYPIIKFFFKDSIPDIKNDIPTLEYIRENKVSVSRFGDGELYLIEGFGNHFTKYNSELACRLRTVLESDLENHIICIPPQIKSIKNQRLNQKLFWSWHLTWKLKNWVKYLKPQKVYFSSFISRFYLVYLNSQYSKQIVDTWKRIWDNKDIVIIEGEYTRLGVGNDLFSNTHSIRRIICPSENAFDRYDEILKEATKYQGSLILIALGQTASVLAYDLTKWNCWAIDVGHIDIEYEWFLRGVKDRVEIPNKYTNEVRSNDRMNESFNNDEYENQIICKIL